MLSFYAHLLRSSQIDRNIWHRRKTLENFASSIYKQTQKIIASMIFVVFLWGRKRENERTSTLCTFFDDVVEANNVSKYVNTPDDTIAESKQCAATTQLIDGCFWFEKYLTTASFRKSWQYFFHTFSGFGEKSHKTSR